MIDGVTFWPRWRAEKEAFSPDDAVISITCHGQKAVPLNGNPDVLRLKFYDMVEPLADEPKFGPETLFTPAQAKEVVEFVGRLHEDPTTHRVVVHCEAGVCRSAAVALYVAEATGCVFPTRDRADRANKWVVRLLAECSGMDVRIPPPFKPEGTSILLSAAD